MADDSVEIEYKLDIDDYINFFVYVNRMNRSFPKVPFLILRQLKGLVIGVSVSMLGIFLVHLGANNFNLSASLDMIMQLLLWPGFIIIIAFCFPIFLCIDYFAFRAPSKGYLKRYYKNILNLKGNDYLTCPQKIFISEQEIYIVSQVVETKYKWAAFSEIKLVDDNLYLFTSSFAAIIIPKKCLKTEDDIEKLYFLCKKFGADS